jgi:acyl-CoA thioester hydrolase
MEDLENTRLVVAESECRYKSPAFYEDELLVRTAIGRVRSRSISFSYEVFRPSTSTLIATGVTLHIVTDNRNKIRSMPEKYRILLTSDQETG